jgi:hypothetical protein
MTLYIHIPSTNCTKNLKHKLSALCEDKTFLFYIYKETVLHLLIFPFIKSEHRIFFKKRIDCKYCQRHNIEITF